MSKQWIAIKHETINSKNSRNLTIDPTIPSPIAIRLSHPRTGLPARYVYQDHALLEIQKINPSQHRSWFVSDSIQKGMTEKKTIYF